MENQSATDTSNFLDWVEIKNFKSIKDLRLDCKRVNIFIGKPNVGKSNILEAIGLLGAEYFTDGFMKGGVRYEDVRHLFYQNDPVNNVEIKFGEFRIVLEPSTDKVFKYDFGVFKINEDKTNLNHEWLTDYKYLYRDLINDDGEIKNDFNRRWKGDGPEIRKYDFKNINTFNDYFANNLLMNGQNLFQIINRSQDLKNEFGKVFHEQGLDLVLDVENQAFTIQRKDGFYIYKYQFYTIADTLRRFMFYITAIESNRNSVLVFEEPEVHSFPPYTQDLAYRMIYSETNQFFVSTHSPYLLQTLVSNLADDQLRVFVTYYENYETKIKALTPDELGFVQEYSTDVFFNLDRFIPNAQSASVA